MKKAKQKTEREWVKKIQELATPCPHLNGCSLSIIIPTFNCSERLYQTLKSIDKQDYKKGLELIVVDSGSIDHTFEMVQHFGSLVSRFYRINSQTLSDVIKIGLSLATRDYVMILYPGTCFTVTYLFATFQGEVEKHHFPDLLYCGAAQFALGWEIGRPLYPFTKKMLQEGKPPTSLNCCWIKREFLISIPRSRLKVSQQLTLDFFIRAFKARPKSVVAIPRHYVDVALVPQKDHIGFCSYIELFQIMYREFGLFTAIKWLRSSEHASILKWIWYLLRLKIA